MVAHIHLKNKIIEIENELEFNTWQYIFNCKKEDLLLAISVVGSSAEEIDCYLKFNGKKLSLKDYDKNENKT
jgi:Protein of unknown function (DUF3606)